MPGLYAILPGKSIDDYIYVLQYIKRTAQTREIPIAWQRAMADFEDGLVNAFRREELAK